MEIRSIPDVPAEFRVLLGSPDFEYLEARLGTEVTFDALNKRTGKVYKQKGILRRAGLPDEGNAVVYWLEKA